MVTYKPDDLKLVLGLPVDVEGKFNVYPPHIGDVVDISETEYNNFLTPFVLTKEQYAKVLAGDFRSLADKVTKYALICAICSHDSRYLEQMIKSFEFFLHCQIDFHQNIFYLISDSVSENVVIDDHLFAIISDIVICENVLEEQLKQNNIKYHNEAARKYDMLANKYKQRLNKNKNQESQLANIVDIVANYSPNITYHSVLDLTVYQLYRRYIRLIMWDDYHVNYPLLPYADKNSKLIKHHWREQASMNIIKE